MTFHLPNPIPENEIKAGRKRAAGQYDAVLAFFRNHRGLRYTRYDISRMVFDDKVPYTSVQRAISDLTKDGLLEKLEKDQVGGPSGVSLCRWTLAAPKQRQFSVEDMPQHQIELAL